MTVRGVLLELFGDGFTRSSRADVSENSIQLRVVS